MLVKQIYLVLFCLLFDCFTNGDDVYVLLSTVGQDGASHIEAIQGDPSTWLQQINPGDEKETLDLTTAYSQRQHSFQKLGFNYNQKEIIWSNGKQNNMERSSLFTGNNTLSVASNHINAYTSSEIGGVAVDWGANNVYWTDQVYNWLLMSSLHGDNGFYVVANTNLDRPGDLAVHPKRSILFWTDYGANPKIERSDLLGENRRIIVDTDIVQPVALKIDILMGKLYWLDTGKSVIESCDFYGSSRRQFYQAGFLSLVSGMSLYKNQIFAVGNSNDKSYLHIINSTTVTNITLKAKSVFDVTVYSQSNQQLMSSRCKNAGCNKICVGKNSNSESECVCPWGEELVPGKRCRDYLTGYLMYETLQGIIEPWESTEYVKLQLTDTGFLSHPRYLYSTSTSVCWYDVWTPDMSTKELQENCIVSLRIDAMHYLAALTQANAVFVGMGNDIARVSLYKIGNVGNVVQKAGLIKGLSVDWVSQNLYWVDDEGVISVSTSEGQHRLALIKSLGPGVRGLLVDPVFGHLYWTITSDKPYIGQALLTGENITKFVTTGLRQPEHMTIDYLENRLYWVDSVKDVIESISLEGTDRKIVVSLENAVPFSIAVFQDHIAWTDRSMISPGIHWAYKDGRQHGRNVQHTTAPGTILLYGEYSQPKLTTNGCSHDNGGCAHLCLPKGSDRVCRCGTAYVLHSDNQQCKVASSKNMDNPLLILDDGSIYIMDVTSDAISKIPIDNTRRAIAIDVDTSAKVVYWTDVVEKTIKKASFNGENVQIIRSNVVSDGLVVDRMTGSIYYTDTKDNLIVSMDHNGENERVIIQQGLDEPRAIALGRNALYWSDWGENPNIMSASLNGSNVRTLVNTELGWPNGIVIDIKADTLYWCDGDQGTIESIKTDGTGRNRLVYHVRSQFFGIALIGDFIYVSDSKAMHLKRVNKNGGMIEDVSDVVFIKPYGIAPLNKDQWGTAIFKEPVATTSTATTNASLTTKIPITVKKETTRKLTTKVTTLKSTTPLITHWHHYKTTTPTTTTPRVVDNATPSVESQSGQVSMKSGHLNLTLVLVIAISVGGVVLLVIVATIGSVCCLRHYRKARSYRSSPMRLADTIYLTPQTQRYTAPPHGGDTPPPYNLNPSPLKAYAESCMQQDNMINSGIQENIYSSINEQIPHAMENDYLCPVKVK